MAHGKIRRKVRQNIQDYITYVYVTPILVTVSIIAASLIIGGLSSKNLESVQDQAVTKQIRENQLLVQNTFDSYAQIVWSGVARVNSAAIDRASWAKFVDTYQLPSRYPEIYAMGVTKLVHSADSASVLEELSQEYGQTITITEDAPGQDINILAYISPERDASVSNIGFNIYSDAVRKSAIQKAIKNNGVTMTEQLQLITNVKAGGKSDNAAFLLYAPYYDESLPTDTEQQRQSAARGVISASFLTERVFQQIFSRVDKTHVSVTVKMGHDEHQQTVYTTSATQAAGPQLQRSQAFELYGQSFAIDYAFDSDYLVSETQLRAPFYTELFGVFVALLVGAVTSFFLRGRHHRLQLDKERDVTRAKDELLSLASHQLRTPATGVKQYVGMVLQGFAGPISSNQQTLLAKAYKSNDRQLRIINDILHLAKLDLGRIVLARTEFDLSELVHDVAEEQKQDALSGKLTLTVYPTKSAMVYADMHMLRMVIENLVSNAIKYTNPGGKVSIRLVRTKHTYLIRVRDTGVGIAEEDAPRLFKQFSRLMNARSHMVSGTGVGLYLANELMQLHHGGIIVKSQPNKGSTFTIELPKDTSDV